MWSLRYGFRFSPEHDEVSIDVPQDQPSEAEGRLRIRDPESAHRAIVPQRNWVLLAHPRHLAGP
jgi:hypothetical protein